MEFLSTFLRRHFLTKPVVGHYLSVLFNPFTAKCGQRQISTKFPNFIFQNFDKQIASCESTGRELSFEWSHHRIMSADSKVRTTLQNSITNTLAVKGLKVEFDALDFKTPFAM